MTLQERCDEIIENLEEDKVKELLRQLNIPFQDKGQFLLCKTMCHHDNEEDASWKLYYYKDTHLFMCYTSCGGQNIFMFLKHIYETRGIEYDWYEDVFLVAQNCSIDKSYAFVRAPAPEKKAEKFKERHCIELPAYDEKVLDVFIKYYAPEWLNDGISKEAMDRFNIRYSIPQNKIIIPHYDINGRLVGIRGRALNVEEVEKYGKYMPVQVEDIMYKHKLSQNLYGLYQNKQAIIETGICYLFESEKSCLQLDSMTIPNSAAAVCGSSLNIFQLKLLMKTCHPKEIVICFDKEEIKGEDKYLKKLIGICNKYKNYCNFSYVYDSDNLLQMKDSPSDHGEEVFKNLLEKRRIVK